MQWPKNGMSRNLVGDLSLVTSSPLADLLQQSLQSKSIRHTQQVHARVIKTQFRSEIFIQNRLIDVYGKLRCLDDAHKLFDRMPHKNTFTWNSILCALLNSGHVDQAHKVFGSMPYPDQCSWNSLVSGFAQHERFVESIECVVKMQSAGFALNEYTYGSALSACANLRNVHVGSQIHACIVKSPYALDVYMGSALIDMYSKCGFVDFSRKVFDGMPERNVVSWNSLITCYDQNGPALEAINIFVRMMNCGVKPDEVTLASVVSACACLSIIREGKQIHAQIIKFDRLRTDLVICNALVDMYAKCNKIREARQIFDNMPIKNVVSETSMVSGYAKILSVTTARSMFTKMIEKNVVSWNALIAGYTQNGDNLEALELFCQLKRESVYPTHYTFGNLLNACANLADLKVGRQAHTHVLKHGFRFQSGPECNIFVGNSLIDMYMKCGSVEDGIQVFNIMEERDRVSWNALIVGYAQNGHGLEAIQMFKKMTLLGEKADHVTMIGVLCACSHAGLVDEGRQYFYSMSKEYGVEPMKDHYTCMVDMLGRAGCLDEAKNLIGLMPMPPDSVVWGSLLAACKAYQDIELGKFVAEKLLELDPDNSAPYVLLSNMYAELGKWKEVMRVRTLMRKRGVIKQPGCSWIEIQSQVNTFMVKDKRHLKKKEIYLILNVLTKMMRMSGYIPDTADQEADDDEDQTDFSLSEEYNPVAGSTVPALHSCCTA
ncbi:Pentatricopeptide repeat-containing protein [Heracleum sosnowskyi]|uniref:Pentatricopeptide repeat-containing protein n=1 Tax=Heracleum sosnowskyi TaxID=360622 RepID=A0AAD8HNR8_9APIA|nr:Pentatricopeptide repeat-containing protein [Heracleum sosnowskyi]